MSDVVIVGLMSLAGTLVGSVMGVLAANRLTNYRIQELERKVEKHNMIIERTVVLERDLKTAFRLIDEMKKQKGA